MFRNIFRGVVNNTSRYFLYRGFKEVNSNLQKERIWRGYFYNNNLFRFTIGFSLLETLGLKKPEKKLDPEEELIMTMKRAILLQQRGEYAKAEQMLHISLRMAQNQNNQPGVTYVYDLMANLALDREEFTKAKNLFVNVLQRILGEGVPDDDLKVIHISIKLARIHHHLCDLKNSEVGFVWCLEKLNGIKDQNKDVQLLRGVASDYYAQLLLNLQKPKEAIKYLKDAYSACIQTKGIDSQQAIMLLNDIGTANWRTGNLDEAESYFSSAIKQCKTVEDNSILSIVKANLGMVNLERGLVENARTNCKEAWKIATDCKNSDAIEQANYCLDELKKLAESNKTS